MIQNKITVSSIKWLFLDYVYIIYKMNNASHLYISECSTNFLFIDMWYTIFDM